MAFSQRMAALIAVVAIPLGVAATSYALTDDPEEPAPPSRVEMESGTSSPPGSSPPGSTPPGSTSPSPEGTPSDEVVSPPPVRDGPSTDPSGSAGDDDGDDTGDDSGGGNDDDSDD